MSTKKKNSNADVAQLLAQFQQRLDFLVHLSAAHSINLLEAVDASKNLNKDLEARLTKTDSQMQEAIVKLRDSAQKGFDDVGADIQELLRHNDELTKRVTELETCDDCFDVRLKAVEAEVELIANFRRAQAAFVLGPTRAPECVDERDTNEYEDYDA